MSGDPLLRAVMVKASAIIDAHGEELTALDQAVGDGDHGANMRRGFGAVAGNIDELAALPFGAALQRAGMTLILTVGGASGPLYGCGLIAFGKAASDRPDNADQLASMLKAGIDAIKARGKSDTGAKTMLDLLCPVHAALEDGAGIDRIRTVADDALEATRSMQAKKGRASFLGERSIGHVDPGARSSALIVHAICDVLEGK